jgi:hypothetical protein
MSSSYDGNEGIMDPILRRQLASLKYIAPEDLLLALLPIVKAILQQPDSHFTKNLTGKQKKRSLEKYQAASLAFLTKHPTGRPIQVAVDLSEDSEYDCVLKCVEKNGATAYKLVQLKQLPSHELNPDADLQSEMNKLKKRYPCSEDLLVAFWINRDVKLDLRLLKFEGLKIQQLWFFGDDPSGDVSIHGGIISDWPSGVCWAGRMANGRPQCKILRFRSLAA